MTRFLQTSLYKKASTGNVLNYLGSIAHICAHLFRTFRVHSAYMRAFEIIHANCHGCLPSFVEQGTQLDQLQL